MREQGIENGEEGTRQLRAWEVGYLYFGAGGVAESRCPADLGGARSYIPLCLWSHEMRWEGVWGFLPPRPPETP